MTAKLESLPVKLQAEEKKDDGEGTMSSAETNDKDADDRILSTAIDTDNDATADKDDHPHHRPPVVVDASAVHRRIVKGVVRAKLSKRRHLVVESAINPLYLDALMPAIIGSSSDDDDDTSGLFSPQRVNYNGGVAGIKDWKISCYLEVMEGGVPCTNPHLKLKEHCGDLLEACDDLFRRWYRQQRACNEGVRVNEGTKGAGSHDSHDSHDKLAVSRLMTFITRYTPAKDENALLKHVDGAGKVDGSLVVALPVDRWTGPNSMSEEQKGEANSFLGHGGGLTFWDGRRVVNGETGKREQPEISYESRSGDVAFIDRAVWHQANPITRGTRWALVIFYKVN